MSLLVLFSALYAKCPCYLVLYMQKVRTSAAVVVPTDLVSVLSAASLASVVHTVAALALALALRSTRATSTARGHAKNKLAARLILFLVYVSRIQTPCHTPFFLATTRI